ncbi:hypothetical protein JCM19240_2412 [Vibrio maritimus]|uniref:Uncharacterized protein n=1 Tax=Vibrio maritimus TaxID=990268 RepID=A0A090T186_9VIBR|nr:hypothetical protein JCM19240_2412 [Vibrio maritimus]
MVNASVLLMLSGFICVVFHLKVTHIDGKELKISMDLD